MAEKWSEDEVLNWLARIGFSKYEDIFRSNGVDGQTLMDLQQTDLKTELEVPILKDRKELWDHLERLRGGGAEEPEPPVATAPAPSRARTPSPTPTPVMSAAGRSGGYQRAVPTSPTPATPPPATGQPSVNESVSGMALPSGSAPCHRCGVPIRDRYVTAMGQNWHETCFKCDKCHTAILDGLYAIEEGATFHPDCLARNKGDICGKCYSAIVGSLTRAMGKKWHPECFQCAKCCKPIYDKNFVANGPLAYHVGCDTGSHDSQPANQSPINDPSLSQRGDGGAVAQVCSKCLRSIRGGVTTTALGKTWHAECFSCGQCGKPIREDKFKTEGDTPVHLNCKSAEEVRLCRGCWRQITDDQLLTAMDNLFHVDCFKCHICQCIIRDGRYVRDGIFPAHPECMREG